MTAVNIDGGLLSARAIIKLSGERLLGSLLHDEIDAVFSLNFVRMKMHGLQDRCVILT